MPSCCICGPIFLRWTSLAPSPQLFREFFERQGLFVFVTTVYVGAGLIATDRRAHALQIYLSKPLTRAEYIGGKLAILVTLLLFVTWVPAMMLLGLQVVFAGNLEFLRANAFLVPAMTVFGLIYALLASFTMLALSSVSTSARFVAVLYAAVLLFTQAMASVLAAVVGHTGWSWLSFRANLAQVGDAVFRMPPRYDMPWGASLVIVIAHHLRVDLGAGSTGARRRGRHVSASVVAARSLSKWYGQVIALNDVTVDVPTGVVGLLGPNGAGKSTFMKLVTGQLRPSQGAVEVLGEPIWGNPGVYARMGYCPDQDAFYERMTGLEWLSALIRLHGFDDSRAADLATEALDTVGLADVAHRRIGAYSKGMRQRVKLAQAIAHDPDLLLLDEPLTGMDPLGRRQTIELIKAWSRAGKTIVVSSHILHEIELMTSTILLINNGRILAEGNVPPDPGPDRRASASGVDPSFGAPASGARVPGGRPRHQPQFRKRRTGGADGQA